MVYEVGLTSRDLKHYPHFDAPIPISEIRSLVSNPLRVAENKFYPFLLYHEEWMPYRSEDIPARVRKSRPIRYSARRDAYIFIHYRKVLASLYEAKLLDMGISHCPIAYRKIPKANGAGGKCNIDFAKDAFDQIDKLGNCVATALDIKSYFENLDHSYIKRVWCDLLGVERLPPDHYAVFKNITKYRFVDQREVYRRLGFIGPIDGDERIIERFLKPYQEIPKQLCSPAEFRAKICGLDSAYSSLVEKNTEPHGVPQGAPISDLIANFYLLEFDQHMYQYVVKFGGYYLRYSDDILLLLPGGRKEVEPAVRFASDQIRKYGRQLRIKESKTCVVQFKRKDNKLTYRQIKQHSDEREKNGFEYLGFRYDGQRVYVRDSTISGFYRKVSAAARVEGVKHALESESIDIDGLIKTFNYSQFSQRFSRVKRDSLTSDYKSWTFYSYLKRAAKIFGPKGDRILRQARGFKKFMHQRIEQAIARAIARRITLGT